MGATERPLGRGPLGRDSVAFRKAPVTAPNYSFPSGSHTFTAPASGWFRIVLWGAGGGAPAAGANGGASGAYVEAIRNLAKGQRVALSIALSTLDSANGTASTATLPNGEVLSAGGGQGNGGSGGVASAGPLDTAINGSAGVTDGAGLIGGGDNGGLGGTTSAGDAGGSGAPGHGHFRGGNGAVGGNTSTTPAGYGGGGGTSNNASSPHNIGGPGNCIIQQVRMGR